MGINIEQSIRDRFAAPLPDNYGRRIIFWQDPDREFFELVNELSLDGVKVLKLTGTNNFAAKMLLSETDTESNYLVYNPISYADCKEDWLLDLELYSEEFRADLLSIRMQSLGIPDTAQMRKAMKAYARFFENKDRVAKLMALKSNYTTSGQLHVDILAVLSGTTDHTPSGVIKALLMAGLNEEDNAVLSAIRKFGDESVFWDLANRYTGFIYSESAGLVSLAEHILITALSVTMKETLLSGLEKQISKPHKELCYSLVNDWMHSPEDDGLYEIARTVERKLGLVKRFDGCEISDLSDSECFPCLNECILRRYMSEISENVVKADDIVKTVEKRRTLKWYHRVQYYYDGILQAAYMQQFYQENVASFHEAQAQELWKAYGSRYYRMDALYRAFHLAFGRSLKGSSTVLEDLYKGVADYVEKLYKNWFLQELGKKWTSLIAEEITNGFALSEIQQQSAFYSHFVSPVISSGSRVFVIISDGLRYEVGAELAEQLVVETRGTAKLDTVQSVYPSATKYGMAALLPHGKISLSDKLDVLCDGMTTGSTAERKKVLQKYCDGNVAVTYRELIAMKQAERRDLISKAQVVYIYHNAIDAVGEKTITEDQVFEACDSAIAEIKNLVRVITNDLSGTNILITSDHGFLYSYRPLEEIDKAEKKYISGSILELDRRYVIADSNCTAEHMLEVPLALYGSEYKSFTPLENIRLKMQGGGMNYVHGGVSLQECMIPVIEYKNMRSTAKNFVDVKNAELQLVSQSRKVSNSIFSLDFYQKEPVGGKITGATYDICMYDAAGNAVSDHQTVIADKTGANGSDRMFRVRLTLKNKEFKKTDAYYLKVCDKDKSELLNSVEFTIDIAFTNDFDF